MIVFATDGFPTIGERKPEAILKNIDKANSKDVRIFVFGEGFNVNTKLLDFLALNHRGEADYVLPEEDIAKKISQFYDRVGSPIMTDLKVEFDSLGAQDVYPQEISDIYRGEQVIVFGRYSGSGQHKVRLTGHFQGQTKTLEYDLEFPEYSENDKNAFVPRLWAGKKVDYLLSEIRKSEKEDKELVDEVTFLAKRYGILTPYTSFLMAEDIVNQNAPALQQQLLQRVRGGGGKFGASTTPGVAGASAAPTAKPANAAEEQKSRVLESLDLAGARKSAAQSGGAAGFYDQAERELHRQGRDGSSLKAIRYIGARTFYTVGQHLVRQPLLARKGKAGARSPGAVRRVLPPAGEVSATGQVSRLRRSGGRDPRQVVSICSGEEIGRRFHGRATQPANAAAPAKRFSRRHLLCARRRRLHECFVTP